MLPPWANNCRSLKVGVDCTWDKPKYFVSEVLRSGTNCAI